MGNREKQFGEAVSQLGDALRRLVESVGGTLPEAAEYAVAKQLIQTLTAHNFFIVRFARASKEKKANDA